MALIAGAAIVTAASFYSATIGFSWTVPNPPQNDVYQASVNGTLGNINFPLGTITENVTRVYNITNTGNVNEWIHLTPSSEAITIKLLPDNVPYAPVLIVPGETVYVKITVCPGDTPGNYSASVALLANNTSLE